MDKITAQDLQNVKKLGDAFTTEKEIEELSQIARDQLTSQNFDPTDPTKMYGNLPEMKEAIRDVSKNTKTPMLAILESKEVRPVKSFTFEMMTEAIDTASSDNIKVGENQHVYYPTHSYGRAENKVMMCGIGIKYTMLVRILTENPNASQVIVKELNKNLKVLSLGKEDFIFNGDKTKVNETDGILTILFREALLNNTATSLTYGGPTNSNLLARDDLENLIFSSIQDNGGEVENMLLWTCQKAWRTMAKWFDDKVTYVDSTQFSVLGKSPMYLSLAGNEFPLAFLNENKVSNVNDLVMLLDMNEVGMVRLFNPITKPMPIEYPMDEANIAVLDSMGLDFLYTLTSGYINGIDKS